MCRKITVNDYVLRGGRAAENGFSVGGGLGYMFTFVPRLLQPPFRKRDVAFAVCLLVATFAFGLYTTNHRFRRSVDFWRRITPIVAEYKLLKFRQQGRFERDTPKEILNAQQKEFHLRTAPKIVNMIQDFGGMMIKVGQLIATTGTGILDDVYLDALKPLQDGVKPRAFQDIVKIIEASSGKPMRELFSHFDETPIGAASIGQVHKATLLSSGDQVVVKVQYPDIAEVFDVDFNNMEFAVRLSNPDMMDFAKAIRQRHERELDFRLEAANLQEVRQNMQAYGVEPALVRIPRVFNETGLCQEHVLVMEYLDGLPLQKVISLERERMAKALGHDSADDMRMNVQKRMRDYFDQGQAGNHHGAGDPMQSSNKGNRMLGLLSGPTAARLFRLYAGARERVNDARFFLETAGPQLVRKLQGRGTSKVSLLDNERRKSSTSPSSNIDLNRVLKVLVHVHGLQMIRDGLFNVDCHGGNVLVLPDGRLGLIDYGMVVRLTEEERQKIASMVVALSARDKHSTARIYRESGYKVRWKHGEITDSHVLHRFATWHFDRVDFSPVVQEQHNGTAVSLDVLDMLQSVRETQVPVWVEQARRLNLLLMGLAHQAARPVSLTKEWRSMAQQAVREGKRR
jgi:predicted unusual protein kinase regulating ubiquinone biosynthesis (AarF/ABC1/UbiB family)